MCLPILFQRLKCSLDSNNTHLSSTLLSFGTAYINGENRGGGPNINLIENLKNFPAHF
jgi:hypothetical protein